MSANKFTDEFKRDAVAQVEDRGYPVREVAERFGRKPAHVSYPDVSMRVSCAKLFATEMAGRVADRGVQIHGGAGYINEYPVERFYRDVRLLRLYEGTTQIQQIIIGRALVRAD